VAAGGVGMAWGKSGDTQEGVGRVDLRILGSDTGRHGRSNPRTRHQGRRCQVQGGRAAREEAEGVVDRWNRRLATGRDMLWSPTIRAALLAGTPWLDVFCPVCRTSRAIDLRALDHHPLASVGSLVLGLRCSWCPGSAPMPKLLGLCALPPARCNVIAR
jgi:hypothetical protein